MINKKTFQDLALQLKRKGFEGILNPEDTNISNVGTRIADNLLKEVSGGSYTLYAKIEIKF